MLSPAEYLQDDIDRALDAGPEPEMPPAFEDLAAEELWLEQQREDEYNGIPPATESRFANDGYYGAYEA